MKKIIVYLITLLLLIGLCYSATIWDFARGVRYSTRNNIELHKNFMKSFSAKGIITEKIICNSCNINKYQIIAELDDFNIEDIELVNRVFLPYYTISSNKLNLSVNREIYDNVSIGDSILKIKNSDNLKINNNDFLIINKTKFIWLPIP